VRLIAVLFSFFLGIGSASSLTLYNSQDPKAQQASNKASEQLNLAFSRIFDVLAAVERSSLEEADKIKTEAVKQLVGAAQLFSELAQQASDKKILPVPRDDEDKLTIRRMIDLSKSYGIAFSDGELTERRLFEQLGKVFRDFAGALSEFRPSLFAKDQRTASQFLARFIRLQEFGRIATAYMAIPRSAL
jgi:hypothetical protein